MKKSGKLLILVLLVLSLALVLNNCGSSGGTDDNNNNNNVTCGDTCSNVAGTYWQTQTVDATQCGEGTYPQSFEVIITQSECNILANVGVTTLTGCIDGSTINWSGSFSEEGGTTTITSSNINVSGINYSGSANWTWSDGFDSCSGTTQISATRI